MPRKKPPEGVSQIALFQIAEVPNAFRKPVQVIHSKPKTTLSLLHRKLANAWIKNASDSPDDDGWWTIRTAAMASDIGFDSNNRAYLIESARALMGIIFEWDVIAPESKRKLWKASVLFPEVEITPDTIRYQISRPMRDQVLSPDMYAMIDLNVVKRFRRASSLALYEHCLRFERLGRTAEVEWQLFRDMLMGESADAKSYQEYKVFKDKVLKVAVTEVNALSDITIVLLEVKDGRRVKSLSFNVAKSDREIENSNSISNNGNGNAIEKEENLLDVGEMVKVGILQSEARQIVKKYTHQQIASALGYTRKRLADKKSATIDNPAAYLRKALANGWALVETEDGKTQAKKRQESVANLSEMYKVETIKDAEAYFNELNPNDQIVLIEEYNATGVSPTLKIKRSKPGKAVRTEFFKWLAHKTWGEPKPEDLLAFAQKLISARAPMVGAEAARSL